MADTGSAQMGDATISDGMSGGDGQDATSTESQADAIAATVNGEEILEENVTAYVLRLRSTMGLDDDGAWAQYLSDNGSSPEDYRALVIQVLAAGVVCDQAVRDAGIVVSDEQLDEYLDQTQSEYGIDDAGWESLLGQVGYSYSGTYREALRSELGFRMLMESQVGPYEDTAEYQQKVQEYRDGLVADATITVNTMPEGLPYDVDMGTVDAGGAVGGDAATGDGGILDNPELDENGNYIDYGTGGDA